MKMTKEMTKKIPTNYLLLLHGLFLMYSLGGIASKTASTHEFMSIPFLFFYGLSLVNLVIYAVLWQIVLRKVPLTIAFANKAVVIIWTMLWGALFFGEAISAKMIVGAAIIIVGVCLVVTSNE